MSLQLHPSSPPLQPWYSQYRPHSPYADYPPILFRNPHSYHPSCTHPDTAIHCLSSSHDDNCPSNRTSLTPTTIQVSPKHSPFPPSPTIFVPTGNPPFTPPITSLLLQVLTPPPTPPDDNCPSTLQPHPRSHTANQVSPMSADPLPVHPPPYSNHASRPHPSTPPCIHLFPMATIPPTAHLGLPSLQARYSPTPFPCTHVSDPSRRSPTPTPAPMT